LKERNFIISNLDNGWEWLDINNENDIETYCIEELEVPQEIIKEVCWYDNAFEISLVNSRSYYRDDWYINLQRCA